MAEDLLQSDFQRPNMSLVFVIKQRGERKKNCRAHQPHLIRSHYLIVISSEEHQLPGLMVSRPEACAALICAVLVLVWSEHSVEMRGEERDAEATLVHAT